MAGGALDAADADTGGRRERHRRSGRRHAGQARGHCVVLLGPPQRAAAANDHPAPALSRRPRGRPAQNRSARAARAARGSVMDERADTIRLFVRCSFRRDGAGRRCRPPPPAWRFGAGTARRAAGELSYDHRLRRRCVPGPARRGARNRAGAARAALRHRLRRLSSTGRSPRWWWRPRATSPALAGFWNTLHRRSPTAGSRGIRNACDRM